VWVIKIESALDGPVAPTIHAATTGEFSIKLFCCVALRWSAIGRLISGPTGIIQTWCANITPLLTRCTDDEGRRFEAGPGCQSFWHGVAQPVGLPASPSPVRLWCK